MRVTIDDANKWAKNSCKKWCKNKTIREFNRMLYLSVALAVCNFPQQKELIKKSLSGAYWCNSYPWPYVHPDFANWEEDEHEDTCTLVTDVCGCVVKHDTSYIAWKIYEATGSWPAKTNLNRFNEVDWLKFLAESDYCKLLTEPTPDIKCVGIFPSGAEETIAVWYETTEDAPPPHLDKTAIVSTYIEKEFKILRINPDTVTWIKIE